MKCEHQMHRTICAGTWWTIGKFLSHLIKIQAQSQVNSAHCTRTGMTIDTHVYGCIVSSPGRRRNPANRDHKADSCAVELSEICNLKMVPGYQFICRERERERERFNHMSIRPAWPMRTSHCSCLSQLKDGCQAIRNTLLVLVPHKGAHGTTTAVIQIRIVWLLIF